MIISEQKVKLLAYPRPHAHTHTRTHLNTYKYTQCIDPKFVNSINDVSYKCMTEN